MGAKSITNHKWKNNICVRCGCEREYCTLSRVYIYSRSGIVTTIAKRLECIDWEVENSKTID